jgi:hypothetical protein
MTNEQIAEVCHEANRLYCESIGDDTQKSWALAEDWQRESSIKGVEAALTGVSTPESQHQSWLEQKAADGWTWGPVKDAEKKVHPCFVPYAQLPAEQQHKDKIFLGIVEALA